jgi:hypothetical protein
VSDSDQDGLRLSPNEERSSADAANREAEDTGATGNHHHRGECNHPGRPRPDHRMALQLTRTSDIAGENVDEEFSMIVDETINKQAKTSRMEFLVGSRTMKNRDRGRGDGMRATRPS